MHQMSFTPNMGTARIKNEKSKIRGGNNIMPIKANKITQYTTSDGKVFLGTINKSTAEDHEKKIQVQLKEFKYVKNILEITGLEEKLEGLTEKDILETFHEDYDEDESKFPTLDDVIEGTIEHLLNNSMCADDLNDFEDLLDMICDVIDDFGGIHAIFALYDLHRGKKRKG